MQLFSPRTTNTPVRVFHFGALARTLRDERDKWSHSYTPGLYGSGWWWLDFVYVPLECIYEHPLTRMMFRHNISHFGFVACFCVWRTSPGPPPATVTMTFIYVPRPHVHLNFPDFVARQRGREREKERWKKL